MNKYKFTNKEILHIAFISIIYVTWIVGIHVLMSISQNNDNNIIYTNLVGSVMALCFTIFLHYPLLPIYSKFINARTEKEAVAIRRSYAIKALYTIVIGFFVCSFIMFLRLDLSERNQLASAIGTIELGASLMMGTFAFYTLQYWKRMKVLEYVDKLQHKNADIEG